MVLSTEIRSSKPILPIFNDRFSEVKVLFRSTRTQPTVSELRTTAFMPELKISYPPMNKRLYWISTAQSRTYRSRAIARQLLHPLRNEAHGGVGGGEGAVEALPVRQRLEVAGHLQQDLPEVRPPRRQGLAVRPRGGAADVHVRRLRAVLVVQPPVQRLPQPLRFLESMCKSGSHLLYVLHLNS
jgi:hypothetical protein